LAKRKKNELIHYTSFLWNIDENKIKTVSTSFSILNDFKKFAKAAFLKRVSFQIVPLPVVINCRTSGDESYKTKIFFGIF
jgi:hypothetical protein